MSTHTARAHPRKKNYGDGQRFPSHSLRPSRRQQHLATQRRRTHRPQCPKHRRWRTRHSVNTKHWQTV